MSWLMDLLQGALLGPAIVGSVYSVLCLAAVLWFCRRYSLRPVASPFYQPPVTVLKPVCGLEKNLGVNLRSICLQDYPDYQLIFCNQDPDDPALPLLWDIQEEFGADRVSVVVDDVQAGPNGKVNNLLGGLAEARHEI